MSRGKPEVVLRSDYRPADYRIERVELAFVLGEDETRVDARLQIERVASATAGPVPLVLDGEDLELRAIAIDGAPLPEAAYRALPESLTIEDPPARFELHTQVAIHPEANTRLSGLYKSSGNFCTQCEAMGFRRITYFLDRPDIMSRFTVSIEADRERYPVLLSNGNRVGEEILADGRHRVRWEDPFPKPCYLFALVAGNLACHAGAFTTGSGREVKLEIWVEPQNLDRCEHALRSLQRAMEWDEARFGLEYDLDLYMIVAVGDFNMGAMENKGLNIFNSKYVLAAPETATDDDYEGIESVIAHEYFHNWTGNRVTCRDWFQLTLKEGLTVYRDQRFSEDTTSKAVNRIANVKMLRARQFPEDEGPMAHPIRPESYISMDNFYTATVYEKGAEVIRMYSTLLGEDGFRRGMDLYFERHDGQAVTCDDFRAAMADANEADLDPFERWYAQAGTPRLRVTPEWDGDAGIFALTFRQDYPDTAFEIPGAADREPLHIPVRMGLLARDGTPLPVRLRGEPETAAARERILELFDAESRFEFEGLDAEPVASVLRDFSAPVRLEMARDIETLAFLMAHEPDAFNRWDAGQQLALDLLVERAGEAAVVTEEDAWVPSPFLEAWGRILGDASLDGSMKALAMGLPSEGVVAQALDVIDPEAVFAARESLGRTLGRAHQETLWRVYEDTAPTGPYRHERAEIDRRRLRNAALRMLLWSGGERAIEAIWAQYQAADNMTDAQAAFALLAEVEHPRRDDAVAAFHARWRDDPLVLDKWFAIQAGSRRRDTLARVLELAEHADFNPGNPNRVRSLVGAFCAGNPVRFHAPGGAGYRFLADWVLRLDAANPQLASRMAGLFNDWRRYDEARQSGMQTELERIAGASGLSKDVYEIVHRALSR